MTLCVSYNHVPISIVLFLNVWWVGRADKSCFFVLKDGEEKVRVNTTDVTKEFFDGRPTPLRRTKGYRPLPEKPKDVILSLTSEQSNASIRWKQSTGFLSMLLRFYIAKFVMDKEEGGAVMRYTEYLLLGPIPRPRGKADVLFTYRCLDLTDTYKLSVNIWSLGTVNMSAKNKIYWVNQYSGAEVAFEPQTEHGVFRKQKQEIERCICQSEVHISDVETSKPTIVVRNGGLKFPVDIQLITLDGHIEHTKTFYTDPARNETQMTFLFNMTKNLRSGYKIRVTRRCGKPVLQTRCGKSTPDTITKLVTLRKMRKRAGRNKRSCMRTTSRQGSSPTR